MIKLPKVIDDDGDTYSVSIPNFVTSGIYQFTQWNKNQMTFTCSPFDASQASIYNVTIVLKDNNMKPISRSYNQTIVVVLPKVKTYLDDTPTT